MIRKRNLKEVLKRCDHFYDRRGMPPKKLIAIHDQSTTFEEDIVDLIIFLEDRKPNGLAVVNRLVVIKYLMTLYELNLKEAQDIYWQYTTLNNNASQTRFKLPE